MRFLVLAPQHVAPPTDGGKAEIYYTLKALARHHEVHFAFPAPVTSTSAAVIETPYRQFGIQPLILPQINHENPSRVAANLFQRLPFKVLKYNSQASIHQLKNYLLQSDIRLLWIYQTHMMPTALALQEALGCAVILREHNVEAHLVEQYATLHPSWLHRTIASWQLRKTLSFEKHAWKRANEVLFLSDSDRALALAHGAPEQIKGPLYPIVPLAEILEGPEGDPLSFVYPLRFSSVQNRFNARIFLEDVWAPFVASHPSCTMTLTGCDAETLASELQIGEERQKELHIRALGLVDGYHACLRRFRYFLSPTYFGSGVRVKLIEAMGQGCLCLCTHLDLNSIRHFMDGQNLVAFRDAQDFAQRIDKLEQDAATRWQIRHSALALARQHFSEAAYMKQAEATLERTASLTTRLPRA